MTIDETLLSPNTPPQSPFLPGTHIQYAIDSTSIGYMKTCMRLYYYKIILGYQTKDESVHLRFGSEFHQALQEYDLNRAAGLPHEEAVHDVIRELMIRTADFAPDETIKAGKYKNRRSLIRSVILYLEHRKTDVLKTYILSNGKPAVELSFRFELEFGPKQAIDMGLSQPYILCGHLDRVVQDPSGDLFVEDHKTTNSTPGSYYFNQFEPNNQMSLYSFGGKVVLDTPVRGVAINAVQLLLTPPYNSFTRGFAFRTQDQLEEWVFDLAQLLRVVEWHAANDIWPQNDTSCNKFSGCEFRNVCAKSPSVRHIYLNSDFIQLAPEDRWNPLKSR